jgi:hypothetical protein
MGRSSAVRSEENPAYNRLRERLDLQWAVDPGDPTATRAAILTVVDADDPTVRVFFGKAPLDVVTEDYESRPATWNEWQPVSVAAFGA